MQSIPLSDKQQIGGWGQSLTELDKDKTNNKGESVGSWSVHNKEIRYENPWLRVEHHDVTTPGGTPGIYGKVCFKSHAIGIVPIDDQGYTYLVGQFRYPLNEYSWEIPEGGCPLGEAPLETAKRELKEETGLIANDWQELLSIHTSNSVTDEVGYVFIARDLSQGEAELEDTEDITVKRLPLKDAIGMAVSGEITDSLSLAALLKLGVLLM